MVNKYVLEKFGVTSARLRQIFEKTVMEKPAETSDKETKEAFERWEKDKATRERFETEFSDIINEGVSWGIKNYQFYAAVDLAWDTPAVSKVMLPLLMYAQSKITLSACASELKTLNQAGLLTKDADGKPTGVDMPKFVETSINMVRSYVTRRHAAQSVKYSNLYPYYKYESRSTGMVGKLKADVMSQEAEIQVDGFGHRHHDSQVMRDAFLYGHSVDFVCSPWEIHKTYEFVPTGPEFTPSTSNLKDAKVQEVIIKEGMSWTNPHPTRLLIDFAHPIAAINDDVNPRYIGYWDVVRYGSVSKDPAYFNKDSISYGAGAGGIYSAFLNNSAYFQTYYTTISAPPTPVADSGINPSPGSATLDPAGTNDRKANIGVYNGEMEQMSMFKTELFRKLIPANHGIGSYPFEVWIRFVIAGDNTVIFAEPMPSTPAAVCSINESDSRQLSASFAHDVIWAQDMMSNLVSQMLLAVQAELLQILGINTDLVDKADVDKIVSRLSGKNFTIEGPIVIPFSLKELAQEMDLKMDALFKIGETRQGQSVEVIFRAMSQLLALLERLTAMSPAEQGQPAPREISATEVTEMAGTTQNVYSFISDGIDEFRAAKKRIIYESTVCRKEGRVQVPIINRYSKKTIEKAGFKVGDEESDSRNEGVNVIGDKVNLSHDFIFTTRDGAERPVNTQAANTLVQLMQVVLQTPPILQALGREKTYDIFNEIFRLSGTGIDLNLELQEGDEAGFQDEQISAMQEALKQLQQMLQELAGATEGNAKGLAEQEQVNERQEEILKGVMDVANVVKRAATDVDQLQAKLKKLEDKQVAAISYRDAPEQIRRQQETAAGFTPPASPTYLEEEMAKAPGATTSVVAQV
jgi:hypothetical protein